MTKEELKKLKANLPTRYLSRIAEETGMSMGTVSKVLNGYFNNPAVIEAAIDLARETKERRDRISQNINDL